MTLIGRHKSEILFFWETDFFVLVIYIYITIYITYFIFISNIYVTMMYIYKWHPFVQVNMNIYRSLYIFICIYSIYIVCIYIYICICLYSPIVGPLKMRLHSCCNLNISRKFCYVGRTSIWGHNYLVLYSPSQRERLTPQPCVAVHMADQKT